MMKVPLALAIESLAPVILSGVGLFLLIRIVKRADARLGSLADAGVVLVVLGGLAFASWRLTLSIHDNDVEILARALLGCSAPGFLFIATTFTATTGVERARRAARVMSRMAVMLLVLGVTFGMSQSGVAALELILAVVTLTATTVMLVQAIRLARERGLTTPAALIGLALGLSLGIAVLSAMDRSLAWEWILQLSHTAAAACFLYSAGVLSQRHVAGRPGGIEPAPVEYPGG